MLFGSINKTYQTVDIRLFVCMLHYLPLVMLVHTVHQFHYPVP